MTLISEYVILYLTQTGKGSVMQDSTEQIRRGLVQEINSNELTREQLEQKFCYVWDTAELSRDFSVESFLAPFVIVRDKTTGRKGTLTFQHRPRFYFDFQETE